MVRRRVLAAGCAAAALTAGVLVPANVASATESVAGAHQHASRYAKVGYFTQWGIYARGFHVKDLATSGSAGRMTTLNYAFGNVNAAGLCASADPWADWQVPFTADQTVDGTADVAGQPLSGNFNQLRELKRKFPNLKIQISLGGWTLSKYFSDAVLTDASRQQLAASCIDMFIKGNLPGAAPGAAAGVFDGIDFDWEWPGSEGNVGNVIRPEDKQNFTLMLREFRRQLDAYGRTTRTHYSTTAFLSASPAKIGSAYEVRKVFAALDFATVQGYDMHGSWETVTNHQSALRPPAGEPQSPDFTVSRAVNTLISQGAPRGKIVVGVPFYSYGWTSLASTANHGLFQTSAAPAPGSAVPGLEDYRNLKALPSTGFIVYRDRRAGFSWLFNGTTFWTFDDPTVMSWKTDYVRDQHLGGAMAWSLDADDAQGSLMAALAHGLR
ncbi:MAG: chitinase [Micromonosporaceae bacterium]|nr:chitinase [Micromonosporaceae bacterium]